MPNDDFWDFMIGGGDELLNTELCPHCGDVIYLDQPIEWVDEKKKIAKCPKCGKDITISG